MAVETQLWESLEKNTLFNPSFNQHIKQSTSFQAIYTRATLICIDLSLSILSIKLLICNRNGETNLPLSYSTIRYPVDLPDKQCLWALTLTLKYLIAPFSYIYGWPLVNAGKNNKKGKPFAAKGWPRSLNKGGHLLKMTITMFVLYAGKVGAKRKERHIKQNQTNIAKGTWQTLFVVEFVCFYFLQSDSRVCSDIRGIRKRHPFSYAAQLTWIDLWQIHSAACHVSYLFTPSYF